MTLPPWEAPREGSLALQELLEKAMVERSFRVLFSEQLSLNGRARPSWLSQISTQELWPMSGFFSGLALRSFATHATGRSAKGLASAGCRSKLKSSPDRGRR